MTILPEFQQVEFDALVLNISPFETQYDEKRSFFTEGTELLEKVTYSTQEELVVPQHNPKKI